MANYDSLINAVKAAVKTNGTGAITGATLQATLLGTIESLTVGYQFMGAATPSSPATPGTPDQKEFYVGGPGTYTNFGSSVDIPKGCIGIFKYDTAWACSIINLVDLDCLNVNALLSQSSAFAGRAEARAAVPNPYKALGLKITYLLSDGWYSEQFVGAATSEWAVTKNWQLISFKEKGLLFATAPYFPSSKLFKEIYLFGESFDPTHTYRIESAKRNVSGKWKLELRDINASGVVVAVYSAESEENGVIKLSDVYGTAGYEAYAVVDWDVLTEGVSYTTSTCYVDAQQAADVRNSKIIYGYLNSAVTVSELEEDGDVIAKINIGDTEKEIKNGIPKADFADLSALSAENEDGVSLLMSKSADKGFLKVPVSMFRYEVALNASDGSESAAVGSRKTTGFIPVKEGNVIHWTGLQSNGNYLSLACYAADKSTLSFVSGHGYEMGDAYRKGVVINSDTKYIRLSAAYSSTPNVMIDKSNEIERLLNIVDDSYFVFDSTKISNSGDLESSTLSVTPLIPCKGLDVIKWQNLQESMSQLTVAFYDDERNFIEDQTPEYHKWHNKNGINMIPEGAAYVRLSKGTLSDSAVYFQSMDKTVRYNPYLGLLNSFELMKQKLLQRNDDITVLAIGDSLTAFFNQWLIDNPKYKPCQQTCRNWFGLVAKRVNDVLVLPRRFDSGGFTEIGTFENDWKMFADNGISGGQLPYWTADAMCNNNSIYDGSITRYSVSADAAVQFTWSLDGYHKMHFIHRKDYRAATSVTISIEEGNGKAVVYDESTDAWVEANGYVFSQKIEQSAEGSGNSQTLSNWRLKFKNAPGGTGVIHMTFTSSGDGYFYYWGTEKWNGNRIIFVNSSRGGREAKYFNDVMLNDIAGRKPDLVLCELMLINEYGYESGASGSHQAATIVEHINKLLFDGALSLKAVSNNFQDFEVLPIIPHVRYEYFNDDEQTFKTINVGTTGNYMDKIAPIVWNNVKALLESNNMPYIDMMSVFKEEAYQRQLSYGGVFNNSGMQGVNGFTIDGVHQNVLGSAIWAMIIGSIFDISKSSN